MLSKFAVIFLNGYITKMYKHKLLAKNIYLTSVSKFIYIVHKNNLQSTFTVNTYSDINFFEFFCTNFF